MTPADIIARKDLAATERLRYENLFDDAIRLTMPGRKRFYQTNVNDRTDDIFDETGANAVAEFVSRMQAGLFPPFSEFVDLKASSLVADRDKAAVNRDLEEIQTFVFEEIWASNFAQESAESINDMAISTGVLLVEDGQNGQSLHNRSVPITELLIEKGADDGIGGIFRVSKMKAKMLPARYPRMQLRSAGPTDNAINREADKILTVIEYTRRVPSLKTETWEHAVVVEEFKEQILSRTLTGAGSGPFIPFRWTTGAGEVWSRGPLINAMAAIRTTNLMVELILENAAMSITGIYQTDNEGVMNADTVSLLPGTILSREVGTNGLEAVNMATGNFNMQDLVLSDQRLNIKRALFNDMLSDPNKTPATAFEVSERMADLAHRTSAGFSRVFYELVVPYMRRVIHILEKRGDIELPVKNGRGIHFNATSPLAIAQNGRKMQSLMQDFSIRAQIYGPDQAKSFYKMTELHPWLIEQGGLDNKIFNTADEVTQAMSDAAQAGQDAAAAQQPPQGAPVLGQ